MLVLMQMLGHKKLDTTKKYYLNLDPKKYKKKIIGTLDGMYGFHENIPIAPEPNAPEKDYIETIDSKGRKTRWAKPVKK